MISPWAYTDYEDGTGGYWDAEIGELVLTVFFERSRWSGYLGDDGKRQTKRYRSLRVAKRATVRLAQRELRRRVKAAVQLLEG